MTTFRVLGSGLLLAGLLWTGMAQGEDKPKAESGTPAGAAKADAKPAGAAKPDALEPFRKLAGEWVGTVGEGDDRQELTIIYRVVGAGSAVVEELFKGTPHEMITVYHLDGDTVMLTHYCAARNQPRMRAVQSDKPNEVKFEFAGGTNIDPARTTHMHSLLVRFVGDDRFQAEWEHYQDGKPSGLAKFDMRRKPAG